MMIKLLSGGGRGQRGYPAVSIPPLPAGYIVPPTIWYKGENNIRDSSGSLDMSPAGGVTPVYADGVLQRCIDATFDLPANPDYWMCETPNNPKFNFSDGDNFTVKFWFKQLDGANSGWFPFSKGNVAASYSQDWGFHINGGYGGGGTGFNLHLSAPDGNHSCLIALQSNDWNEVTWNHYSDGHSRVMVNHNLATQWISGVIPIGNHAHPLRLVCGWSGKVTGYLDEVRIFDYINERP
jgi:hypothetical protein